jgi:transposase
VDQYIGLDVSLKETAISVRQDSKRIWRGKCPSDPKLLAEVIRKRAPDAKRVVFETGPLSVWFYHALTAEEMPAICIDARHAKAALDMAANKTDANDADGLAQLAEVGFYREVRVKGFDSMLTRTLVGARTQLIKRHSHHFGRLQVNLGGPSGRAMRVAWASLGWSRIQKAGGTG